jgi:hypothetical protein
MSREVVGKAVINRAAIGGEVISREGNTVIREIK